VFSGDAEHKGDREQTLSEDAESEENTIWMSYPVFSGYKGYFGRTLNTKKI
jgi:hypothetical protein